jgi:hypothetical protein
VQGRRGYDNSNTPVLVTLPGPAAIAAVPDEPLAAVIPDELRPCSGALASSSEHRTSEEEEIAPSSSDIVAVTCGGSHCAALTREGVLLTWCATVREQSGNVQYLAMVVEGPSSPSD